MKKMMIKMKTSKGGRYRGPIRMIITKVKRVVGATLDQEPPEELEQAEVTIEVPAEENTEVEEVKEVEVIEEAEEVIEAIEGEAVVAGVAEVAEDNIRTRIMKIA